MFDKEKLPPDARQYFDTLPKFLQESLIQTGVELRTKKELVDFCEYVDHDNP